MASCDTSVASALTCPVVSCFCVWIRPCSSVYSISRKHIEYAKILRWDFFEKTAGFNSQLFSQKSTIIDVCNGSK